MKRTRTHVRAQRLIAACPMPIFFLLEIGERLVLRKFAARVALTYRNIEAAETRVLLRNLAFAT
jgi:hypothetical protein